METVEATKEEKTINLSLAVLDKREADLLLLKAKYESLTIKGIEDIQGYEQVDEARKELKSTRVQIEKDAKDLRDPLVKMSKAIIAREGKLVDMIEPLEKSLHSKTKAIDEERERIKADEDRKKAEKINNRIKALNDYRYAVDIQIITSMTDEKFEDVLNEAKSEFDKAELIRIEEEKKQAELKRQEEERQAELRKQEELKLEEQKKLLEQQRLDNEAKEKELAAERDKIRIEQEEKQKLIDEENRKIKEAQDAKEKELAVRQRELETQENERIAKVKAEAEAKAKKEREKQEEIARKKREKEEAEQKLLFGEDSDRFSALNESFDKFFVVLETTRDHMKSEQGKKVFSDIETLIYQAAYIVEATFKT